MADRGLDFTYNDSKMSYRTDEEIAAYEEYCAKLNLFSKPMYTKEYVQELLDKLEIANEKIEELQHKNDKLKLLESIGADDIVRWNDDLQIYEIRE